MAWSRPVRTALRTVHLLGFASLYGGHLYGVAPERLVAGLWITLISGTALLLLDAAREPLSLVQVRGLATAAKIALVAAIYFAWDQRIWLLSAVAVIGAVSSHMPSQYRYYSPFHGSVVGSTEKG